LHFSNLDRWPLKGTTFARIALSTHSLEPILGYLDQSAGNRIPQSNDENSLSDGPAKGSRFSKAVDPGYADSSLRGSMRRPAEHMNPPAPRVLWLSRIITTLETTCNLEL